MRSLLRRFRTWRFARAHPTSLLVLDPGMYLVSFGGMGVGLGEHGSMVEVAVRRQGQRHRMALEAADSAGEYGYLHGKVLVEVLAGDTVELVGIQHVAADRMRPIG